MTPPHPAPVPAPPSLVDNPAIENWFSFADDGRILLKTGKVEVGQGVLTALIQIAADELDVAPDRFDILSGDTADGPAEPATSSSISIEQTGFVVRRAAAAARALMLAHAATLLQAERRELTIDDGMVRVSGRETPLDVWRLAAEVDLAVEIAGVPDASAKLPAERRIVGTSLPRIDLHDKALAPVFLHDVVLDDMVHGRVVQPPSPVHRLADFDARTLSAVFPNVTIVRDGSFIGVIASNEYEAIRAQLKAAQLAVWHAPEPPASGIMTTLQQFDAAPTTLVEEGEAHPVGNQQIQLTVTKPYTAHASLAPSCAIATCAANGRLEVLSHTQAPHGLVDGLAIALGVDAGDITIRHRPGAGTFGHSAQDDVALDAALLARAMPGRPVRVLWSRADDFKASPMAPAMVVRVGGTLGADGRIASLAIESVSQPHARRPGRGGFAEFPNAALLDPPRPETVPDDIPAARGGGADRNATPLYTVPNLSVQKRILREWPVRTSALRGLGAFANIYAIEALIDELAATAADCPVAFRTKHLADVRARHVVERVAESAGWPGPAGEGEAIGIAFARYKNKSAYVAIATRVRLEDEVRLLDVHAAVDAGEAINPDGIRNQIEGSILQAASWALTESVAVEGNEIATDAWANYPILTFSDVPAMHVEIINRPQEPGLGIGEAAIGPAAASIGNAVARALGIRLTNLPLTRDAIESAINA